MTSASVTAASGRGTRVVGERCAGVPPRLGGLHRARFRATQGGGAVAHLRDRTPAQSIGPAFVVSLPEQR